MHDRSVTFFVPAERFNRDSPSFFGILLLFQFVQIQGLDFERVVLVPIEYNSRCEEP
jgi:hypothetical protein